MIALLFAEDDTVSRKNRRRARAPLIIFFYSSLARVLIVCRSLLADA
jgi:hypothetical protein